MANDGGGSARDLSHDELGGGGQLVGGGNDGGGEDVAVGVGLAAIVNRRLEAGDADGDVGQSFAPGASEGVGDEDGDGGAGAAGDLFAKTEGGGVGVAREKRDPARRDV